MATPSKAGVKRKAISLDTKIGIINEIDDGKLSKTLIADKYGLKKSTLSTIIKNRDSIKSAYESDCLSPARKKMRFGRHEEVDDALLKWFREARSSNIPLSGETLMLKANELAKMLGYDDFTASSGFIERFKKRHGIISKSVCGESAAVDLSITEKFMTETLPQLLKDYEPKDIFNADETGLFYKLLLDKTLQFKGEKCHGGKRGKNA
jgi:hypothetical protein